MSIVIPAYNEAENLKDLIPWVFNYFESNAEVILVNDASTDDTARLLESLKEYYDFASRLKIINRSKDMVRGMGASLKEGTREAKGDIIVWMMGDCSDHPEDALELAKAIDRNACDVVIGARENLCGIKWQLSCMYSKLARKLFGIKAKDITNAFRAFKSELKHISLESNDFAISPEFSIKAHKQGFIADHLPVRYLGRTKGTSNFNVLKMGWAYFKILLRNY